MEVANCLELIGVAQRSLGLGEIRAQALDLVLELGVLILGVDRVASPTDEIAEGLDGTAGPRLDRRERLLGPALKGVKGTAARDPRPAAARRVSDAGSFGNSCCCDEWPRTPRGCDLSPPPRR